MKQPKDKQQLNMKQLLEKFKEQEESSVRRKGTFKIDTPFEEAVKSILKAKPHPKKSKRQ